MIIELTGSPCLRSRLISEPNIIFKKSDSRVSVKNDLSPVLSFSTPSTNSISADQSYERIKYPEQSSPDFAPHPHSHILSSPQLVVNMLVCPPRVAPAKRYPMCLSCCLVVCGFWYCIEWYAHEHQIFLCASLNLLLCLFLSRYNGDDHCVSIFHLPLHLRLFSISMHRIVKFTNSAANSQLICPEISYIAQFQAEITSFLIMTYSSSILSSPKTSISSPHLSGISPLTLQNYKQIINKLVIFYSR